MEIVMKIQEATNILRSSKLDEDQYLDIKNVCRQFVMLLKDVGDNIDANRVAVVKSEPKMGEYSPAQRDLPRQNTHKETQDQVPELDYDSDETLSINDSTDGDCDMDNINYDTQSICKRILPWDCNPTNEKDTVSVSDTHETIEDSLDSNKVKELEEKIKHMREVIVNIVTKGEKGLTSPNSWKKRYFENKEELMKLIGL